MTYPAEWVDITIRVKTAAGWCCEACGHPHDPDTGYILTVHHIDGDKANVEPNNLIALCQRCHLRAQGKLSRLPRGQPVLPGFEREVTPLWEVIDARKALEAHPANDRP